MFSRPCSAEEKVFGEPPRQHDCCHRVARQLALHFDIPEDERRYAEHLRSLVASRAIVYNCAVLVARALLFAWALLVSAHEGRAEEAIFVGSPVCTGVGLIVQLAVCALLGALRRASWWKECNWEIVSLFAASLACAIAPWAAPHCGVPEGLLSSPAVDFGASFSSKAVGIMYVAVLSLMFGLYTPVRFSFWPVIPVCAICSYAASAGLSCDASKGAADIAILAILLVLPTSAIRELEALRRREWRAEQVEALPLQEVGDLVSMPAYRCTLTLRLADSLAIINSDVALDAFFGQRMEGIPFVQLLARPDRPRLQELVDTMSVSRRSGRIVCSISLPSGLIKMGIVVVDTGDHDHGRYVVGLTSPDLVVLEEREEQEAQTQHDPPNQTEEIAFQIVLPGVNFGDAGRLSPMHPTTSFERLLALQEASEVLDGSPMSRHHDQLGSTPTRRADFMTLTGSERTLFGKPTEDSLAFSCYTEGDLASLAPVRRIMVVAATQTESAAQADASVNTSIVMEELGFRCIACSKPPKPRFYDSEGIAPVIPGPEAKALISKLDKKKASRDRSRRRSNSHSFRGADYNGCWVAVGPANVLVCDWLQNFTIFNGCVRLGDGQEVQLHSDKKGSVLLCGGELRRLGSGNILRKGKSGLEIEFAPQSSIDLEDPELTSTWSGSEAGSETRSEE